MIKRLRLVHFKGFRDFTIHFGGDALLVGPNNAGKSTIIGALRLCGSAIRVAMRTKASEAYSDEGKWVRGHPLRLATGIGFVSENVRYEFQEKPSRLDLQFTNGALLHILWPLAGEPFFWAEYPIGMQVTTAAGAKAALHLMGLIPTLTPVDNDEKRLSDDYLRSHTESRLASRHFRNQLSMVKVSTPDQFAELTEFLLEQTPELVTLELIETYRDGARWLDLYYRDAGSKTEKEIYWAGDGLQIWLQVLFHAWRNRDVETIVLDEPDVFLHPDLQRRLIRVLEESKQQTIMATHAPEMASEANQGSVVWIERTKKRAKRVGDDKTMGDLTTVLGSGFNLAVARALRSRVALFVEGEDMKVLRLIAKTLGAENFAKERGLTVIPIGGFTHWPSVEAFSWIKSELLGSAVEVQLLLDRDYREDASCSLLESDLAASGVHAHVWHRKELENYLIETSTIARLAEMKEDELAFILDKLTNDLKNTVVAQFVKSEIDTKQRGIDVATATHAALARVDAIWSSPTDRLSRVPGKDLLASLNRYLQGAGKSVVSARRLAASLRPEEIDPEMAAVILEVESKLA